MKEEEIKSLVGEAFHTAFRKGITGEKAKKIWDLIKELPDEEWDAVLDFVYECIKEEVK